MSRPMFYPMGTLEIGEVATMSATERFAQRKNDKGK
jgi:hypothetical protein